ncbi:hypothetical protein VTK26DRAFT_9156 [Humicola hyalothermophila]
MEPFHRRWLHEHAGGILVLHRDRPQPPHRRQPGHLHYHDHLDHIADDADDHHNHQNHLNRNSDRPRQRNHDSDAHPTWHGGQLRRLPLC